MAQSLHFSASTSVKNLFGRGLVTDQVAAVFELVKNSYDADAKEVEIIFSNLASEKASLTIYDNGTGMNLSDIETKWMIIGTDSKKDTMYSPIYQRPLNGDKGIGRFSVDRLGSFLHMEAQKRGTTERYLADFDWTLFDGESRNISEIEIPYIKKTGEKNKHGVSLTISGLRDIWDDGKLRELYRNLRQFKSPFSQDDNFKIFITAPEFGYNKREVTVEKLEGVSSLWMTAEISDTNPEIIRITVNKDGLEYESIQTNSFSFGSIKTKVFMFNQGDKIRFANRYGLRVRDYGNIRLYRDSFRIYPYGEAKNDWLDIDRRQTQGMMRFLGTRDLIGYVQIGKEANPNLKPLTNRQGLEKNAAFEQLQNFVVEICIKTLESYYFSKIKKAPQSNVPGSIITAVNTLVKHIFIAELSKAYEEFLKTPISVRVLKERFAFAFEKRLAELLDMSTEQVYNKYSVKISERHYTAYAVKMILNVLAVLDDILPKLICIGDENYISSSYIRFRKEAGFSSNEISEELEANPYFQKLAHDEYKRYLRGIAAG